MREMGSGAARVAIDVGGTFVDFVAVDEAGNVTVDKQPATPARLVEEIVTGLERLPIRLDGLGGLFHGTTVAINAVVQRRGARVGLLTTSGFRDVLEIGRGSRPNIYDPLYRPPAPLVPRHLRREVPERLAHDGSVVVPLDLDAVDREADALVAAGAESIAVCFLNSYVDATHERRAVERIRERHPQIRVQASVEATNEWHEFERTSTAVLNAYVQPLMDRYISSLAETLRQRGLRRPLAVMQSNGGVMSGERAALQPIRTLESGPAGGVIGARALARELGLPNVICADVGGTTYDVALIEDGEIIERTEVEVEGRPVVGSAIDIVSIGAGGGSIASLDALGGVTVGPRSAGADPGPACFGLGGTEPTVTDCQVVLGRIDPRRFLGARMQLDLEAARTAISAHVAEPTGVGVETAASGVLALAETNMTYAIRAVTVERGLDPRDFAMVSYGGGGGMFAAAIAQELEVPVVVVPRAAANFSAWGILTSDYREDVARTKTRLLDEQAAAAFAADARELRAEATRTLAGYGFEATAVDVTLRADARYAGQDHTITVAVEPGWLDRPRELVAGVRERFVAAHKQLYGHGADDAPLELVTCRCRANGLVTPVRSVSAAPGDGADAVPAEHRDVCFGAGDGFVSTPVYERDQLSGGAEISGPAVVEEWTTTTLIPPGWTAAADRLGNLVLRHQEAAA
ncbi:hydantoinase/oxoprolinase family protein [Conexibacter woesei]|uniref:5-oxoprolinase (ATP-hydrolyzing) n=1 Tax=Conexibacter woesei (strain DSM 14684 / CCUG 47730 / CIP 108061 / JCM 11494 / NBRC 100937 / ID131577) TaxID=469383 RepID=D3F5G7_CONWI|nr:hydantoinase/oxoprolinase family protein [Conexibacter woesei]ADB50634.1 5-oxoprolinase (ATP-hydrolyzing) [Conexibacter woesei DSM 14684]